MGGAAGEVNNPSALGRPLEEAEAAAGGAQKPTVASAGKRAGRGGAFDHVPWGRAGHAQATPPAALTVIGERERVESADTGATL